ncbi:MAG: hypothetical protein A3J52_02440 [Omnitrophica bacterium RIFCSPHIGHO2_02_FULL_49_9]|nr:MAG: hypothetical protein A3J52_02440 [Omnitrophica bacterium RIFCSPHIGHO2_02_FULL_49_9]OGW89992.1 MAG: hypothetical protein A3A73_04180 [Omnitrophica bacterium RIFCSPLOWO2_01_FULL_50_24]
MTKQCPALQRKIIQCQTCPRLVRYISEIKKTHPSYWCRPVPAFGDFRARILVLGLAPGRFGSNRTGRMFTGDASGTFLYPVLHELGLATKPSAVNRKDGLKLKNTLITAVVRCAPPKNKPTSKELAACRPFWQKEIALLADLRVVVALGKVAHDEYVRFRLKERGGTLSHFPFRHGAVYSFQERPEILIDTYHPSRQNTNTGRLTRTMFLAVFKEAIKWMIAGE